MQLNDASMNLILRFEVGGGEPYYDKHLRFPTWPEGQSGITIGVGYDMGYNTGSTISDDWGQVLNKSYIDQLLPCAQKTGTAAQSLLSSVKNIDIPWSAAFSVYNNVTIPKFWRLTCSTFPGIENCDPNCQGALLSLVFNRGTSMKGDSRLEMRNIKDLVPKKDYKNIAAQIRAMKRIWKGTSIEQGMSRRRDAEADLVLASAN